MAPITLKQLIESNLRSRMGEAGITGTLDVRETLEQEHVGNAETVPVRVFSVAAESSEGRIDATLRTYDAHPQCSAAMVSLEATAATKQLSYLMIMYSFALADRIKASDVRVAPKGAVLLQATREFEQHDWLRPVYNGAEPVLWQAKRPLPQ